MTVNDIRYETNEHKNLENGYFKLLFFEVGCSDMFWPMSLLFCFPAQVCIVHQMGVSFIGFV